MPPEARYTLEEAVALLEAAGIEVCLWPGIPLDPQDAEAAVADPNGFLAAALGISVADLVLWKRWTGQGSPCLAATREGLPCRARVTEGHVFVEVRRWRAADARCRLHRGAPEHPMWGPGEPTAGGGS